MEITTKMVEPLSVSPLFRETILTLHLPQEATEALVRQYEEFNWKPDAEYVISITKASKRRSLDANAYAWVLLGKLAEKLRTTPLEAYRRIIADSAAYTIVPIREDAVEAWITRWSRNGKGWLCEDMGACRNTAGYRNIKCFHGSSAYTQAEMSRFIDLIIDECNQLGIPTMTPAEIEKLKGNWK